MNTRSKIQKETQKESRKESPKEVTQPRRSKRINERNQQDSKPNAKPNEKPIVAQKDTRNTRKKPADDAKKASEISSEKAETKEETPEAKAEKAEKERIAKETLEQLLKRPNPKGRSLYNSFNISKPNQQHQIDILFLPYDEDKEQNKLFKYCFTLIDVASRYKAARQLTSKTAKECLSVLEDIYAKDSNLKKPEQINADGGNEFNLIKKYCTTNGIEYRENKPSHHSPFVESFNKQLSLLIFKRQQLEEIKTGQSNREWFAKLQDDVKFLNNRKTRMIGMKPKDAIKLEFVPQQKQEITPNDIKKVIPVGQRVRRLLNIDEVLDTSNMKYTYGKLRKATDPYWSIEIYTVTRRIEGFDMLPMHEIQDEKTGETFKHHYTYWQLQAI